MRQSSLVDWIRHWSFHQPDKLAFSFLSEDGEESHRLSFEEIDRRVRAIAACLQSAGAPGERCLLLYPAGLDFVPAFLGCLYSGAIAVPCYPPRANRISPGTAAIVADAAPRFVLTTAALRSRLESRAVEGGVLPELGRLACLETDQVNTADAEAWRERTIDPGSLAFLQYTSGSTARPKGVMVSHGNLLHNEAQIQRVFRQTRDSVVVGWLPLYHDMGLIGNVLQPLYTGASCFLMSPMAFLQQPVRWLAAVSRHGATTSGGPNFAYELCAKKITAEQRASLDLSHWEVAFNGAEPIRAGTLELFAETFAPCGFRAAAFSPCYGLAEATLLVTGSPEPRGASPLVVSASDLAAGHARLAASGEGDGRALVGSGEAAADQRVVIADPEARVPLPEGRVGEIWLSGPSVAQGYWGRPEETAEVFQNRLPGQGEATFLRTGDLGFLRGGELVVTGRLKDLIIIRGRNLYPQDIELTVGRSHPFLRADAAAAFSVDVAGEERLVIVQEVERHFRGDPAELEAAVREQVAREHEVQVEAVVLLKAGTLPKTSSGKVRRRACREAYLAGSLLRFAESAAARRSGNSTEVPLPAGGTPPTETPLLAALGDEAARALGRSVPPADLWRPLIALGLDSLSAVELGYRIESRFGFVAPLASLLGGASLASLAEEIAAHGEAGSVSAEPEGSPEAPAGDEISLSRGQEALLFLERLAPEAIYNIPVAARVRHLDREALRRAFDALIERHPALRAAFAEAAGKPAQRVHSRAAADFAELDAAGWSSEDLDEALEEEAYRRFDMARPPLLRLRLFRLSPEEDVVLLVIHHIISDYWSLAVLARDLSAIYEGVVAGSAATLPPASFTFVDVFRRQQQQLAGAEGERLSAYWRNRLAGPPSDLDIRGDRLRPASQSFRGALRWIRLPPSLAVAVHALSREAGATAFITLLAAWELQLGRYTHQEDFVVGSPTSGRSSSAAAEVVGYFVNPVPLRTDLAGDPPFELLLERVRRTVLAAVAHADYPFAVLAQQLRPVRDPARSPIFQTTFGLVTRRPSEPAGLPAFSLGVAAAKVELGGLTLEAVELRKRRTQFDLAIRMAPEDAPGGGLLALLEYSEDLFDATTALRMLGHFEALLAAAVAAPGQRLSVLPLLTPAESSQAICEWNDTTVARPGEEVLFHTAFSAHADRDPEAPALLFGELAISYGELDRESNQLARYLKDLGVGLDVLVAVAMERSPELVKAFLAILKAGGVYLPLDPSYPAERLAFMLEDSGTLVLLTHEAATDALPSFPGFLVRVDSDWPWISGAAAGPLQVSPLPDNLAYVIYTSGSTGAPKAVQLTHRGLSNLVAAEDATFSVPPHARVLQFASPSFDASVFEMVMALTAGAALCLAPREELLPGPPLSCLLERRHITHVTLPPSSLLVLPAGSSPHLETIVVAGEACSAELVDLWSGGRAFWNAYGPTEATVWTTVERCSPGRGKPAIGRPIPNAQALVLGPGLDLLPVGVPGELYLGGAGLARGYLGRPGLTAEKFVPHPFGSAPGLRLYKTGDVVSIRPDGSLEFFDRVDRQVKLRGFRIELGEIEAALLTHGSVSDAAVVARQDRPGDPKLVAYVVPRAQVALSPAELRDHLRTSLPDYMVPALFVELPSLPRTPSGKVDRKELPAAELPRDTSGQPGSSTQNPIQELVAAIWGDVLGLDRVGVGENFFEAGGHSLLGTQVVSRLNSALGLELPLSDLFEAPSVAGLAQRVEAALRGAGALASPPIERQPGDGPPPLSFAQQRLWFIDQLEPENPAYIIPIAIRIDGPLKPAILAACLCEIVGRHSALRTRFERIGGEPRQVVAPPAPVAMPVVDLGGLADWEPEARRLAAGEARRPFRLDAGPLLRPTLLRLGPLDHVALLTLHHIAADGWALGVLLRELSILYPALLGSLPPSLPELPVQYSDFAAWQLAWLRGAVLEAHLGYWRRKLAGELTVLKLPLDRERKAVPTFRGADHFFTLPEDLVRAIRLLGRREGATLFMTLLAAFKALLYRYSGQTDLLVGTVVANRGRVETENLIGCFINTLVLRTGLRGGMSFRELLGRVRETAVGAYTHQDLPFERLVEELAPERDLSRFPLFQVRFTLESSPPQLTIPGLALRPFSEVQGTTKFDLTLNVVEAGSELVATLTYRSELFDPATIERLCARFVTILAAAVEEPATILDDFDLQMPGDRGFEPVNREVSRGRFFAARLQPVPLGAPAAPSPESID